jgi:hypothetical protein
LAPPPPPKLWERVHRRPPPPSLWERIRGLFGR